MDCWTIDSKVNDRIQEHQLLQIPDPLAGVSACINCNNWIFSLIWWRYSMTDISWQYLEVILRSCI